MNATLLMRLLGRRSLWLFALLLLLAACDSSTSMVDEEPPEPPPPEEEEGTIVAGVNLDVLFAAPTEAEINTILDTWQARQPLTRTATAFQEEVAVSADLAGKSATMRVVSHTVGGVRHYGAIVEPAEAVEIYLVKQVQRQPTLEVTGEVVATQSATLRNELQGRIVDVGFAPGARVEAGQVLLRLDVSQEQAQLAEARADLQIARLALERAQRLVRSGAGSVEVSARPILAKV